MNTHLESLVVAGVDGTAIGYSAVRLAAAEATLHGRPLVLISAYQPQSDDDTRRNRAGPPEAEAERWLAKAVSIACGLHPGLSPRITRRPTAGDLGDVLIDAS